MFSMMSLCSPTFIPRWHTLVLPSFVTHTNVCATGLEYACWTIINLVTDTIVNVLIP